MNNNDLKNKYVLINTIEINNPSNETGNVHQMDYNESNSFLILEYIVSKALRKKMDSTRVLKFGNQLKSVIDKISENRQNIICYFLINDKISNRFYREENFLKSEIYRFYLVANLCENLNSIRLTDKEELNIQKLLQLDFSENMLLQEYTLKNSSLNKSAL